MSRPLAVVLLSLTVAALLLGAARTAAGPFLSVERLPVQSAFERADELVASPSPSASPSASRDASTRGLPGLVLPDLRWVETAVSWVILLFLAGGAALLAWRWPRVAVVRRRLASGSVDHGYDAGVQQRLLAELADAAHRVDSGANPRLAVIDCWVRLERAAAAAGTGRRASETPEELVQRVLSEHDVDPAALRRLTALYREARFSTHPVDAAMRAEALATLAAVAAGLQRPVPA